MGNHRESNSMRNNSEVTVGSDHMFPVQLLFIWAKRCLPQHLCQLPVKILYKGDTPLKRLSLWGTRVQAGNHLPDTGGYTGRVITYLTLGDILAG